MRIKHLLTSGFVATLLVAGSNTYSKPTGACFLTRVQVNHYGSKSFSNVCIGGLTQSDCLSRAAHGATIATSYHTYRFWAEDCICGGPSGPPIPKTLNSKL